MLRSLFSRRDEAELDQQPNEETLFQNQQQDEGLQQPPQDNRFAQEEGGQVLLAAIWDQGKANASSSGAAASSASGASSSDTQVGAANTTKSTNASRAQTINFGSEETPEERRERQRLEGKENVAKKKLSEQNLDTLADALDYCKELVNIQLQRAKDQKAPMNEAIYGDAHARKAIVTLLPDQFVRSLFIQTTRDREAWPRIRPLFGSPPYHFLKPEDAGFIRASGIAAGRTNMTYDKSNETAAYSQFGVGHLVDNFFREYRVVTTREPQESDQLPCDIERLAPQNHVFLNVRVPKRSKGERMELLKDITKRRAVLFPQVGETISLEYSSGLRQVWGKAGANLNSKLLVKSMVPRAAGASTAAVVALKVS